jgi:hypothetical protein
VTVYAYTNTYNDGQATVDEYYVQTDENGVAYFNKMPECVYTFSLVGVLSTDKSDEYLSKYVYRDSSTTGYLNGVYQKNYTLIVEGYVSIDVAVSCDDEQFGGVDVMVVNKYTDDGYAYRYDYMLTGGTTTIMFPPEYVVTAHSFRDIADGTVCYILYLNIEGDYKIETLSVLDADGGELSYYLFKKCYLFIPTTAVSISVKYVKTAEYITVSNDASDCTIIDLGDNNVKMVGDNVSYVCFTAEEDGVYNISFINGGEAYYEAYFYGAYDGGSNTWYDEDPMVTGFEDISLKAGEDFYMWFYPFQDCTFDILIEKV